MSSTRVPPSARDVSLRRRLTLLSACVLVIALVSFTVVTVTRTRAGLRERTDEELSALGSGLMSFAQRQAQRVEAGRPPLRYKLLDSLQLPEVFDAYAVVVAKDGTVAPLPRLARQRAQGPDLPAGVRSLVARPVFDVDGPGGSYRARVVAVPGTDAVMFVSISTAGTDAVVRQLVRAQVIAGIVLLALFLVLTVASVRVGLRPLDDLTNVAGRIASGSSGERANVTLPGTEIGRLGAALNGMLTTVERNVVEREQAQHRTEQFAADAAHELRTPVTAILGYAELYRLGGIHGEDRLAEVFGRIHHEAARLDDLVGGLLMLNRLDHTASPPSEPVEVTAVCREVAADSMAIDPAHPVDVHGGAPTHAWVRPDHLVQIVANLLSNVRSHTPPGTAATVTVRAAEPGDASAPDGGERRVTIVVADDGPGIPTAGRPHVFDRFYRADPARLHDAAEGGSGLGLAIVRAIARDAGGDATLVDHPGRGTAIEVSLPAPPDA